MVSPNCVFGHEPRGLWRPVSLLIAPPPCIPPGGSARGRNRRFISAWEHDHQDSGPEPVLPTYSTSYSRGVGFATRGEHGGTWRGCIEYADTCVTAVGSDRTIEGAAGVLRVRAAEVSTLDRELEALS